VLIWGGGAEILIDGIRTFANTVTEGFAGPEKTPIDYAAQEKNVDGVDATVNTAQPVSKETPNKRVEVIVTPKQAHEEMIIDKVLKMPGKGQGAKDVEAWLTARLN
jgi:hypothetical protein